MKQRIIFLVLSLTIIFGAILFSNIIIADNIPLVPVNMELPENIFEEGYITLGTIGGKENNWKVYAANLPDGTEVYRFSRMPFHAFTIQNDKIQLYCLPFTGKKEMENSLILTLLNMAESEEYVDISHYLTAMSRFFGSFDSERFYGFNYDLPEEVTPKLRKVVAELSEIYGFEYEEGPLTDFITPPDGYPWYFKEEYGNMAWVYIKSSDRFFSGNMDITIQVVTGNLAAIDTTYLVEKIDEKWKTTRILSSGIS